MLCILLSSLIGQKTDDGQLLIGFAYDYTLTKLGDYSHGSYDIILGYDCSFEKKRIITPRYF